MTSQKFVRLKPGSFSASTSALTLPEVVSGLCFVPSAKAWMVPSLKAGRGCASQTLPAKVLAHPVEALAQHVHLGARGHERDDRVLVLGMPGVVWSAIASQTSSMSRSLKPWPHMKSRAALAPSTSNRSSGLL